MREYVNFKNRNRGYRGDSGTYAAIDTDENGKKTLTVCRAMKGIISSGYTQEIEAYAAEHGIDFSTIRPGDKVTIKI